MTLTKRPPAISGVPSGNSAAQIVTVYPSIASTPVGRLLGVILDCLPVKILGVKLSNLLFGLPLALVAVPEYFRLKLFGVVYALTNRSIQVRSALGNRLLREVQLTDFDQVVVRELAGQKFFPAAEIDLLKGDDPVLTLSGILRADVFRQSILEARQARILVGASLGTIRARSAG